MEGRPGRRRAAVVLVAIVAVLVAVLVGPRLAPSAAPEGVGATASIATSASAPSAAAAVPSAAASPASPVVPATDPVSGLPWVERALLPAEARRTILLIRSGGPYPYSRDGVVFANRERLLPPEPRGYYREYTVPTPGEDDRGARRIVAGDDGRLLYWSGDHYATFARVRP